jgi:hypothetical protein
MQACTVKKPIHNIVAIHDWGYPFPAKQSKATYLALLILLRIHSLARFVVVVLGPDDKHVAEVVDVHFSSAVRGRFGGKEKRGALDCNNGICFSWKEKVRVDGGTVRYRT